MINTDVEIQKFLDGYNPKKYVVAIECDRNSNKVSLIIDDPIDGKKMEEDTFLPFLYMMDLPSNLKTIFYKGDSKYKSEMIIEHGIHIKKLRVSDKEGKNTNERLVNGYKYLVESTKSFNDIVLFFKKGGINIYDKDIHNYRRFFNILTLQEQYMISKGVRLFKGFETYQEVHKLVFDIETTGLNPKESRVFMIGLKDNRGYEKILTVFEEENDDAEIKLIVDFFKEIDIIKPSVISGYNSENFDFHFLIKRSEILGIDLSKLKTTLSDKETITKRESNVKLGGESEKYQQTIMWGYNIIDTYFSVRRAQAINSEIKEAGLKYITKFNDVAKPNRMYINDGFNIGRMWRENLNYLINPKNNEYILIPLNLQSFVNRNDNEELNSFIKEHEDKTKLITGSEIVYQYLLDDLWETDVVDSIYNEATFMFSKWLPTSFNRTSTIGGSSSWNLIMIAWSYENGLALPKPTTKRKFVGGLSRLLRLGYIKKIVKADYAGLYPSIQLEHNVFPKTDVDNVLYRLLKFFKETRDIYKTLAKESEDSGDVKNEKMYNAKQLPIKILNNSNFGANGSEYFLWSDMDVAERITCTGRQYLRKMCEFFVKFNFRPVLVDTDGVNFETPEFIETDFDGNKYETPLKLEDVVYVDHNDKIHKGLDAFFAKLNNEVLQSKYMKVDNDGMWIAGINLSRKNYVSFEIKKGKEKLKLTGNSIKSKKIPKFIETFLKKGLVMIIKNKPKEFVDYYHETIRNIYFRQLSLLDVASKAKVKKSINDYVKEIYLPSLLKDTFYFSDFEKFKKYYDKLIKYEKNDYRLKHIQNKYNFIIKNGYFNDDNIPNNIRENFVNYFTGDYRNGLKILTENIQTAEEYNEFLKPLIKYFAINGQKNGIVKSKQAHMDLIIENEKIVNLGDNIYYVNSGTAKSHGDSSINNKTGKSYVSIIDENSLNDVEYNIPKYIKDFNKKVEPLLIVFNEYVQDNLLVETPNDIKFFTEKELELVSWDIETYTRNNEDVDGLYLDSDENLALFKMEDREVQFWNKIKIDPKTIFENYMVEIEDVNPIDYYNTFFKAKKALKQHNIKLLDINSRLQDNGIYLRQDNNKFFISKYNNKTFTDLKEL